MTSYAAASSSGGSSGSCSCCSSEHGDAGDSSSLRGGQQAPTSWRAGAATAQHGPWTFVPSLPVVPPPPPLAAQQRLPESAAAAGGELSRLHAALVREGVRMEQPLQRQQQQQQPQPQLQPQPQQQQQQSQPQPLQLDFSKLAQQLQQSSAAIARLKLPQELAGASTLVRAEAAAAPAPSTRQSGLQQQQQQQQQGGASDLVQRLSAQLAALQVNVQSRAGLTGADAAAQHLLRRCSSGSAGNGRPSSSGEQPVTPVLASALPFTQQRQQAPAAAAVADAGRQPQRASQLLLQQQQVPAGLAPQQQLAAAGLAQLQEVTRVSATLAPLLASMGAAASDTRSKLLALDAFFRAHPRYHDASALQALLDANKALRQEVYAKSQQLAAALGALRTSTNTPADKRLGALQEEAALLRQQLHARDTGLAAAEDDNRRLRQQLGLPQPSPSEGCLTLGRRSGASGATRRRWRSRSAAAAAAAAAHDEAADVSRRLWADDEDRSSGGGSDSNSEGSSSKSSASEPARRAGSGSADTAALQAAEHAEELARLCAAHEAALAAKQQQVSSLQQQLAALAGAPPAMRPLGPAAPLSAPRTLEEAGQTIAGLKASLTQLQCQLQEQELAAAARAAEHEASFARQLGVEKRQHEMLRQDARLLAQQLEDARERLAAAEAAEASLQQQLEQAQARLEALPVASAAAGGGIASQQQQQQQQQQAEAGVLCECVQRLHAAIRSAGRLAVRDSSSSSSSRDADGGISWLAQQLEAAVQRLLADAAGQGAQLAQLQGEHGQLQQQLVQLADANAAYEEACCKAQQQLQACETQLLELAEAKQQCAAQQQQVEALRRQLDLALRDQQAAAAHTEQCRQQLAAVAAQRRQLEQRLAQLEGSRALGGDEAAQQLAVLRGQLAESQAKEERLHVANAQLQERISALQAAGGPVQQQALRIAELQLQLQQLQAQLAAAQQQQQQPSSGDSAELARLQETLEDRTSEVLEWQIHADALETDLHDLQQRCSAADAIREELQQQLAGAQARASRLECDLRDAAQEHSMLLSRFDAVSAELGRVQAGATSMRQQLEHLNGPAGPAARVRQLEALLQSAARKCEAAEARASKAAAEAAELGARLRAAEDEIIALEGQTSILESELQRHT